MIAIFLFIRLNQPALLLIVMKYVPDSSGELKVRVIIWEAPGAMVIGRLGFDTPPLTLDKGFPFTNMSVKVSSTYP